MRGATPLARACAAGLVAASRGPADPIADLERLFEAGRYADAAEYCEAVLAGDPSNQAALHNAATALVRLGRHAEALEKCGAILSADPCDPHALRNKVLALEGLGRHEQAAECCRALIGLPEARASDSGGIGGAGDAWSHNSLGLALARLGRDDEADGCFDRALGADPDNVTALMNKALLAGRLGRAEESAALYDRAAGADPSVARDASRARAGAYASLGRRDESFLAAQGVADADMPRIIRDAARSGCTVFHQFCQEEYERAEGRGE